VQRKIGFGGRLLLIKTGLSVKYKSFLVFKKHLFRLLSQRKACIVLDSWPKKKQGKLFRHLLLLRFQFIILSSENLKILS